MNGDFAKLLVWQEANRIGALQMIEIESAEVQSPYWLL